MPLDPALTQIPGLSQYLAMKQYMIDQGQQEQQRGLQQQFLQKRQELGPNATPEQLIGLGTKYLGPKEVVDVAGKHLDRQDTNARLLMTARENALLRRDTLQQNAEGAAARLKRQEDRDVSDAYYKQQLLDSNSHIKELDLQLKRMGIDIAQQNADTKKQLADQATQSKTDKTTQQLGTALERAGLNEADATIRSVEDILQKTPDVAKYLSGPGAVVPNAVLPNDIVAGRQAFQKLFNITLKNRSGAAVTPPEFERLKAEFATGAFNSPESLKEGVRQARNIISQHYRGVAAGYGSDALNSYNENLRQTGGTPLLEQQGEATTASAATPTPHVSMPSGPRRIANDKEFNALPSGTPFIGPDGKLRRKP